MLKTTGLVITALALTAAGASPAVDEKAGYRSQPAAPVAATQRPAPVPPAPAPVVTAHTESPASARAAATAAQEAEAAAEVFSLRPFRAVYRVSAGILSGTFTLELEHRTGEDWVLTSTATTRGVARMLRRGDLVERSVLRFTADGVKPMEYVREDNISGPERNAALIFAHDAGRVFGTDYEQPVDLPMNGEVIDRLSMQVRLMRDLSLGLRPEEYFVVDRGDIREMDIAYAGTERIEIGDRRYEALRLDHQRRGSSRSTRLWTALEYDFLPIRIEQKRRGSTEWLGVLQEVSWGEPPAGAAAARSAR